MRLGFREGHFDIFVYFVIINFRRNVLINFILRWYESKRMTYRLLIIVNIMNEITREANLMALQIKADKDYTLLTQLLQVADIFVKVRERELLPQNLSATSAAILFLVEAMGKDVTPAKISRMLLREPHSVSGILMRMEKQGLIKRTKNMERKNLIRITLTTKGESTLKQAMKKDGAKHVLSKLSEEQRRQLKQSLLALKEAGMKELHLSPKALPWP